MFSCHPAAPTTDLDLSVVVPPQRASRSRNSNAAADDWSDHDRTGACIAASRPTVRKVEMEKHCVKVTQRHQPGRKWEASLCDSAFSLSLGSNCVETGLAGLSCAQFEKQSSAFSLQRLKQWVKQWFFRSTSAGKSRSTSVYCLYITCIPFLLHLSNAILAIVTANSW